VPGDTAGNVAFGTHVLVAAVIVFGGTLQLIPHIRTRAISFHRWKWGLSLTVTAPPRPWAIPAVVVLLLAIYVKRRRDLASVAVIAASHVVRLALFTAG
jgi:hypothetical protein